MDRSVDLTEGSIVGTLIKLALPIMGTSFIQMAYNLTDIMWLGRYSTNAVAAAGTAGFYSWLGAGLILISQVGVGVKVAQSYGKSELDEARLYITNGMQLNVFLSILFGSFLLVFRHQAIGFFNMKDAELIGMSMDYLVIVSLGMTFNFINPIFSAVLNSTGNSMTPFKINAIGLVFNMILDPLLIFGFGPIKAYGIKGAAIATVLSQIIVTIIFIVVGKSAESLYSKVNIFKKPNMKYMKDISKLGLPAFFQTSAHASISMILTRIVAQFGPIALAVQSVGSKIESLSWMTAGGFSTAISAFIGQNYGAKKDDRVVEGYRKGIQVVSVNGLFVSLLFILAAKPLFAIFVPDDAIAIHEGAKYMRILGYSQLLTNLEIGSEGAFNGLGKTIPPAAVGITMNSLRIPLATYLANSTSLGLSGVWWSITITAIAKGVILTGLFTGYLRRNFKNKEEFN